MEAEIWQRMRAILESALDKPVAERRGYVVDACAGDDRLQAGVLSYISAYSEGEYLEGFEVLGRDRWTGRQLGPWLLGPRIGEGGMGAVYEALRVDRQYEQRVAVKLVSAALSTDSARRFWNERQLLARLEHPNVARLLDGGVTDDGAPYLVMEYVPGVPIDVYCAERNLPADAILTLFQSVCSAVEHAHRNLIVHRDIKPGNILVTADGVPKLLDFGIAKLLNATGEELTLTSQRPMTPAYASPEQVLGDPITTATDIYSLGVLLYRLLTGCSPYRLSGGDRAELERAILEQEPGLPSSAALGGRAVRNRLRGDLDAIAMTALQKEPARRYRSAGLLLDDIQNFQRGLPVSARADSAAYRTFKFARRHRVAVTAGFAVCLSLIIAAAVSLEFARQAGRQRVIAEKRFSETRGLANYFLFDFDDSIRAGTTAARRSVVSKGLEYLDRLAVESRGDTGLQRELMAGYSKIGDLQGNIFGSNLGDVVGARSSYLRALDIGKSIQSAGQSDPKTRHDMAAAYQHLGEIEATAGNCRKALQWFLEALALLDPSAASSTADVVLPDNREAALQVHSRIAWVSYRTGDYERALAQYERYGQLARRFYGSQPAVVSQRRSLIYARERKGETLARMERTEEGLTLLAGALDDYRALARQSPGTEPDRDVPAVNIILGDQLHRAGRNRESLVRLQEAIALVEPMVAADPHNSEYRRDLAEALTVAAEVLNDSEDHRQARRVTGRALAIMRENLTSATQWDLFQYARVLLKTPFAEYRNNAEALADADRALRMTDRTDPSVLDLLALANEASGNRETALTLEAEALSLLPPGPSDLRTDIGVNLARFRKTARQP